jgi:hypothetical protein
MNGAARVRRPTTHTKDKKGHHMDRQIEKRSAFPRAMTDEDTLWALDHDICRKMFASAMTYSQEEYVNWNGYSRRSMNDCDFDYFAELAEQGYWPALVIDQGETLVLAKSWREAGQHEEDNGSECIVAVKLEEEK